MTQENNQTNNSHANGRPQRKNRNNRRRRVHNSHNNQPKHRTKQSSNTSQRAPKQNAGTANKTNRNRGKRRNNQHRRRTTTSPAFKHRLQKTETSHALPEITSDDTVRVIPVSGAEEIGRNMNVIETKDDIIVVDAGFQFVSEDSNAPGVNYILPNTQYLEERKHKVRAVIVTHGHLDHIGGIPFIMERIGNPPIYTQHLTALMIKKRQEEFPHTESLTIQEVVEGESFTVGKTTVKTFPVTHSIPDAMGLSIRTKHGNIVITGDIKLTHTDGEVIPEERRYWEEIGAENNLALLCDSTNADREGFSAPEDDVLENLQSIIRNAPGRLIIGTFASQFERLIAIIQCCEEMGKKVVTEGRSIKVNIEIALRAKLLEVKPNTFINAGDMDDYPNDRIVILSTGAQGEEFAALMRMATDKHKHVTLTERDTVVLSSSVIPGNEIAVQKLKDNIYRKNVRVVNYKTAGVHSSGHGNAGEIAWIHRTIRAKYLIPVHGHHYHLKSHMYVALENGYTKETVGVPDNGTIFDITNGTEFVRHPERIPTESVLVDGFSVGTRQEVVLRDRISLSTDGMFVIIATVNNSNGKLRKSPDIISRGFVYLRENQQLLSEARLLIKKTVEKHTEHMHPLDLDFVKNEVADTMSGFLMQKTHKTPMVIPVLIGI
jgi:ribonuclease J